jgi:coenzyme F420-reducing hydrogenase delta subunit
MFRSLCDFTGIDTGRIKFSWVSAAEGAKWADIVNATVASIREKGPYTEYKKVAKYPEKEVNHG